MKNIEQQFLNELDAQLWKAADKLRSNLDAANYKHVVLGLIFLKYVSDAFEERQKELIELFQKDDDDNIYYLPCEDYDSDEDYQQAIAAELEINDYYAEKNVFWVPKTARWNTLKEKVTLPTNSVVWQNEHGEDVKLRSVSWLIDNAFDEIEKANPKLKGILNRISQYQLDANKLISLVNEFSTTRFHDPEYNGEKLILTPPAGNANFAWMLHMLHHLAPTGSMALFLANGSMSSNTNNKGEIRKTIVEHDLMECMVALPGQLFTNTQIPACIWFLTKDKSAKDGKRDRRGEVLFIDARNLGYMKNRVLRDFKDEDTQQITNTFHDWQREWSGEDNQAGFSFSADLTAIRKHDFVLTPGRYVGVEAEEDDGIPFAEKIATLTSQLKMQFKESDKLEGEIKKNLAGLGFDV